MSEWEVITLKRERDALFNIVEKLLVKVSEEQFREIVFTDHELRLIRRVKPEA